MASCEHCGKPLKCSCRGEPLLGSLAATCPQAEGALWIHVLDDAGDPVEGVTVDAFKTWVKTGKTGLVKLDRLPAKAFLAALGHPIPAGYDPPLLMSKPATVAPGQIAYVLFTLKRRAALSVRFVYPAALGGCGGEQKELFELAPIKVTWSGPGTSGERIVDAGAADLGKLPAGRYKVKAELVKKDDPVDLTAPEVEVELLPGGKAEVELEVVVRYTHVRFIGHCLLTIPKQRYDGNKWTARYNGKLNDAEDMQARVDFVGKAMDEAFNRIAAADKPWVLKVFAVPECFFQGRYGAYEHEMVDALIEKLQLLTGAQKWKDWLFAFGTVNSLIPGSAGEMFNIAPVVKGGHCYTARSPASDRSRLAAPHTKVVQKSRFSAELISKTELEDELRVSWARPPITDEATMFQGTENDEKLGKLFRAFLADGTVDSFAQGRGLDPTFWSQVRPTIPDCSSQGGLLKVVRILRKCALPPKVALSAYVMAGGDSETIEDPKKLEVTAQFVTWEGCASSFVRGHRDFQAWMKDGAALWKANAADVKAELRSSPDKWCEGMLPYHQEAFLAFLDGLGPAKWEDIPEAPARDKAFRLSWVPVVKKVFEMYLEDKRVQGLTALMTQAPENFDAAEYCFASARRAGPLLDLAAAGALKRTEKVVFGLEICADHGNGRLKKALRASAGTQKSVDVQLIASCGMQPNDDAIAARAGGWVFNCDGWNGKPDKGGTFVERKPGGPDAPETAGRKPVYPHTVVARGTADGKWGMGTYKPQTFDLTGVLGWGDPLFGEGPGELHIYAAEPLPTEPVSFVRVVSADGRPRIGEKFYRTGDEKADHLTTDLCGEIHVLAGHSAVSELWWKDGNRFIPLKKVKDEGAVLILQVPEPRHVVRFIRVVATADGETEVPLVKGTEVFTGTLRLQTDAASEIRFYEDALPELKAGFSATAQRYGRRNPADLGPTPVMCLVPAYKIRLVDAARGAKPAVSLYWGEDRKQLKTNQNGEVWFEKGYFGDSELFLKGGPTGWIKLLKVDDDGDVVLVNESGPPPPVTSVAEPMTGGPSGAPPPPMVKAPPPPVRKAGPPPARTIAAPKGPPSNPPAGGTPPDDKGSN